MKCRKCGNELKETDNICLNCGTLVNQNENDLYDDINRDDEESVDYNDETETGYSNELDELLNSYTPDTRNDRTNNDAPDYSLFNSVVENDNEEDDDNRFKSGYTDIRSYYSAKNPTTEDTSDDFDVKNLVKFTENADDDNDNYEDNNNNEDNNYTDFEKVNKKRVDIVSIIFRLALIIIIVIAFVVLGILTYKFIKNQFNTQTSYEVEEKDNKTPSKNDTTSKYDLTEYPNYILDKSWVCGRTNEEGKLSNDRSSYFQYDFYQDLSYVTKILNEDDSLETGTYTVSLEDISNDKYTYKVTAIATLMGGYKTKYTFTLITNKEGTIATYRLNNTESSCEELDYYNSKLK